MIIVQPCGGDFAYTPHQAGIQLGGREYTRGSSVGDFLPGYSSKPFASHQEQHMPTCCTQVLSHAVSVVAHCCSSFLPLTKAFQAFVRMSAYSDDSEVEYDDPQVVLNRYRKARFRQALASPDSYYRACQELAEVFTATSDCSAARVKKATFAELISDTRLAIEHCDG